MLIQFNSKSLKLKNKLYLKGPLINKMYNNQMLWKTKMNLYNVRKDAVENLIEKHWKNMQKPVN
jgi:hypothetical protein